MSSYILKMEIKNTVYEDIIYFPDDIEITLDERNYVLQKKFNAWNWVLNLPNFDERMLPPPPVYTEDVVKLLIDDFKKNKQ